MTAKRALTDKLRHEAHGLGFDLAGVCAAVSPTGFEHLRQWLESGYGGQMKYLGDRLDAYRHPTHVLDGAKSVVMLAMNYHTLAAEATAETGAFAETEGRISQYAWGSCDYHDLIHDRLKQLVTKLKHEVPGCGVRGVVDTAPLLEREFAQLAGLGWVGKNTLLLNRKLGSWFFLAALLTDVELEYDSPWAADHCGSCRACLDACPTDAFTEPYVLDATRCISYLTIELREPIPADLRSGVGDWLFGCDVCQDVCPWNRRVEPSRQAEFQPRDKSGTVDLVELFSLDEATFRQRFRKTPLWRSRRRGILRNAAIVLGNRPADGAIGALARGLSDEEPLVRGASAWALGQFHQAETKALLVAQLAVESDETVREEIEAAMQHRRSLT